MKIALLVVVALLGLVILAGLVLYFLGRSLPEWWPAVKAVRLETRPNGEVWAWNKDSHGQEIAFRTKEEQAPARLVREIMGDNLPFGGTWTFELTEEGTRTRLTITEDGFIKPPLFRAIAQHFIGLDKTMKDCAANLAKRLERAP